MSTLLEYVYRVDADVVKGKKGKLALFKKGNIGRSSLTIDLTKLNDNHSYIGKIPNDMIIAGILFKKGDLVYCSGGIPFKSDRVYKVSTLTSPRNYGKGEVEYKFAYGKWLGRYINGNHNKNWYILAEGSTGYDSKGNYNILKNGKWVANNKASSPSSTEATTNLSDTSSSTSSTSSTGSASNTDSAATTDSTTGTSSTASTDSTTRSFDFLDDVLGTQKEGSKDKTTELDPNQIANTIVNETKLNDTAISSLVSTYLNSLQKINRSYNTQTK